MGRLKNILKEAIRLNFDYVLHAISWRMPSWLFYYYHTFLISTDDPKLFNREHKTYFKRFITHNDIPLLKKIGIAEELVKKRLSAGDRCVIMGKDDDIMSIIWGCSEKRYLKLSGAVLDIGDNGIIIYAGFTNEEARFKGLFPTSFHELYQSYVNERRNRIFSAIHSTNTNSLKLHLRMNFQVVGETYYVVLFGINICYYKTWPHKTTKLKIFINKPPEGLYWV